MRVWVIQDGEPIPGVDGDTRKWRAAMLCEALAARGHEVLWWASVFDHFTKRHRSITSPVPEVMPGVQLRLLEGPGYKSNKSLGRWRHYAALATAFAAEARTLPKPNVILCSLPTLEFVENAVAFGQQNDVPVLVDVRDLWPDHYLTMVPSTLRWLMRVFLFGEFRKAEKCLSGATGLISISESFVQWALKKAQRQKNSRDGVFPMGYPALAAPDETIQNRQAELIASYSLQPETLKVVFVGSVSPIFDFETVIQAAKMLERNGHHNIQILIVGAGERLTNLRLQAEGVKNIILTGWFDHTSISAILDMADVGLAPYIESSTVSGSLPNKVFEYMAAGLPLLSSHKGDLADVIAMHAIGHQYRAGDVDSLVEGILWFASHPDEAETMGRTARYVFDEHYSADIVYSAMARHIERVAGC